MPRSAGSRKRRQTRRTRGAVTKAALAQATGIVESLEVDELVVSPERALLEQVRASFAIAECGDCGHATTEHAGIENDGACTVEGCECEAMVPADDPAETAEAATATVYVTISEEAQQNAVAALLDGVTTSAESAEGAAEGALAHFRLRFEEFVTSLQEEFDTVALPDELQPGETLPDRTPSPAAPETPGVAPGGQLRWRAALVPEGRLTDDGRAFAPESITWRELPLTLMAMIETTEGGHIGAQVSGRIDRIWRDADGMIRGEGVFDDGDYGNMIGELVADQTLRGVSVDTAIHAYEVGPRSDWFDDDGNWAPKEKTTAEETDLLDILMGESDEPVIMVVTEGVIGMATVCPFQAFRDATIEIAASLVASSQSPALFTVTQQAGWTVTAEPKVGAATGAPGDGVEAPLESGLTAAAASLAPVAPPASWFENPNLDELTPLVVTADGRVYGHAAAWDTCHIGIPDVCTTAPHSNAAYAYFLLKEVECAEGERVSCGTITLSTGHADRGLGRAQAAAHYDDTGTAAADVVCGEDEYGIWVAGAVRPDMDAERVRDLRGAVLSGDWRNVNGNLELVALLAVNVPGFPVPRTRALVAAGDDGNQVLALVAAGVHNGPVEDGRVVSDEAREKLAALAERVSPRLGADDLARIAELASRAA